MPIAKRNRSYPPPPSGTVEAALVDVEDLGEQTSVWGTAHKIKLVFELDPAAGLRDDGRRHVVSQIYTLSLSESSNLYRDLNTWGIKLDDSDEGFEVNSLIGEPAQLVLVHKEGKEGRVFARIVNVLPAQRPLVASGDYKRKDGSPPAVKVIRRATGTDDDIPF